MVSFGEGQVMLKAVLITLRFVILIFGGHQQVVLENAALRQQLAILKRNSPDQGYDVEIACFGFY